MKDNIERRKYARMERPFVVNLSVRPHDKPRKKNIEWETVTAKNLSAGGALFYYHKELEVGQLIELQIYFVTFKTIIKCVGKVIRVQKPPSSIIYRVAVSFIEIGDKEKNMIAKYAENFIFETSSHR